ncbi:arsenate reductase (glutaredoxin) [Asticcacaulis sp. ZE23SCel15]|uniref:arsenate reductase (glutaredoxin) n=1 Tax=Asticcacaulis sp. ZE23SCel15 TaxID=3059027 RepID=UPI00265D6B13|nr:arsenate reductase (glutaredoxin) [Asticcacaulis sp. ZE23SCel15]WKL57766.1 arsenate reductase (glutaredoxin) [Asticcacaulis sp. ZE23SCel15]
MAIEVTIYHRPTCSTSRKALELIRAQGVEPTIIDYGKVGWTKPQLQGLLKIMGVGARDILRTRGTPAEELGLTVAGVSDNAILEAMIREPVLVERPIVVTSKGAVIARPVERLLEIL